MFDFSDVPSNNLLPEGVYHLVVYGAEIKDGKSDPNSKILNLQLKVKGGEHDGRSFFERFNIVNKNEVARNIAVNQLKRLRVSAGHSKDEVSVLKSVNDLIGLEFSGKVKIRAGKDGYDDQNSLSNTYPLKPGSTEDAPF